MTKFYWNSGRCMMILLCFLASGAWAQSRTVTGSVKGADDSSNLPGVSILEKGTVNGTTSDAEGNFTIQVKDGSVLVVSFVGYASQEVQVGSQTNIVVSLLPDIATLNEVVVIGYGTVKKADATGSVTVVDSKVFNRGVVTSPQELLQGKTAGVLITSNSGAPGNASTIRIRGGASLNASNDPLIVIDGVPMDNSNLGGSPNILSTINPNDIESFTVLKDASATAIYGLRASNGVIIITTKRGGKDFKVSYTSTTTIATAPRKVNVFNGDEFRALIKEHFPDPNSVEQTQLGTANTNWQKEIYHKAALGHDHNVSVSGTLGKMPYRASVGYNNTDGILKTYNFERTTAAIALDPSLLHDQLKISINVKGLYNTNNFADQGAIGDAVSYDPTKTVFNGNTRWRGYTTWTTTGDINAPGKPIATANPVAKLALTDNTSISQRSIGNVKFDYAIPFLKELHANLNLGYDYTKTVGHNNVADSTQWTPNGAGVKSPYTLRAENQLLDFYLSYNKEIPSLKSKIEAVGGYSWAHFYKNSHLSYNNAKGEKISESTVNPTEYYLVSFFGRLNYTINNKYLLTGTLRNDGTSRFKKTNQFGLFPSAAFAWKIKQEAFLADSKLFSELKLRAGWGITGQQDVANDYPYLATYTRSDAGSSYQLGGKFYNTLRPDAYNSGIKWETTETLNAGIDFGFLTNKITASVDVYHRKSKDLISYVDTPQGTNFGSAVLSNIGDLTNDGIELNINTEIISTEDFQWTLGYNITYNKNKITHLTLNNNPDYIVAQGNLGGTAGTIQAHKVGSPRYSFYVYQQLYDGKGKPVEDAYVDRNGDGAVNIKDLYIYKKPDPTVYMGINSRMSYKSLDFAFSARANLGNYVYNNVAANSNYIGLNNIGILNNVSKLAQETNFSTGTSTRFSDFYVENASFLRMDNVNLGYTFAKIYKDARLRVGAGVQNVFVITKYKGIDPEVQGGLDNNFFPRTRSYFLNLNLQF